MIKKLAETPNPRAPDLHHPASPSKLQALDLPWTQRLNHLSSREHPDHRAGLMMLTAPAERLLPDRLKRKELGPR
ncbi:MAG: hypothetical protein U9Q76_01065 [candidate division WOR-3 bacterium]|nr:hypothetical protein [candidate division WOR-3 bacterium]